MKIKKNKFKHLVFAGTFDRLHIGHKKMLDLSFSLAEKVSIGITTENLYHSKPLANLIPTWQVRKGAVEQYLREQKWLKRVKFFRIEDIYGPSINDETMDSILVTKLTKANAEKINKIRENPTSSGTGLHLTTLGTGKLKPLKIVVAPLVRGDDGEVVTSERIRMGEIDEEGHNFQFSIFPSASSGSRARSRDNFQKKSLILPKYLRQELRKPLGKVIAGSENQLLETARKLLQFNIKLEQTMVISVGDVVTASLLSIGFDPEVKIIDLKSRRKPINSKLEFLNSKQYQNSNDINSKRPTTPVSPPYLRRGFEGRFLENWNLFRISNLGFRIYNNLPGTINIKTALKIKSAIKSFILKGKKSWIVVKGEEDLLALPAILFAPLQSVVLYGQMDLGIVAVEVTEENKKEVEVILRKFV